MTEERFDRSLRVIPLVYLFLLLGSAAVDRPFMWGANHLRYFPIWAWFASGILLLAISTRTVREFLLQLSLPKVPVALSRVVLVCGGTAIFVILQDATNLLGDGYLLERELDRGLRKIANEPFSLWMLDRVLGVVRGSGSTASDVFSSWSFVSGLGFLALTLLISRRIDPRSDSSYVIGLLLLLGGYVQLFFGYHETYPILYPLLLIYVWLGICANRGETSLWIPLCVLSLMISLHFTMATLLPSAVLLMADSGDLPTRPRQLVRNFWTVIPGVLLFLLLMWVSDFSLTEYRSLSAGEIFLPLLGSPTHSIPYSALSINHLVAFLNQELLVFMPAICLIPFIEKRFFRHSESTFLLLAGGTACFTTFFGLPLIGAFRDWDALSFPAVFVTIWVCIGLIKCYDKMQIRQISLVVAVTAGVHVVLWILINADSVRAVSRFEDGLRHSQLSIRARAYGWETLGSYYASIQDSEQAVRSYREATRSDPMNARYPNLLGVALMRAGDYVGAARQFERSVVLDDNRYEAILNLGLCLVKLRRFDESINILKQARDICPDLSKIFFALGIAYHGKKAYSESISAYERALDLDPANVDTRLNLAELYGETGDNRRKHDQLVIVLSINPQPAVSQSIRDWLAWYKARQTKDQSRF